MKQVISFEGIPGVGKTTLIRFVQEGLREQGISVINVSDLKHFEGDRVGNKILRLMTYNSDPFCRLEDPFIEAFLSQAIRYSICYEVLEPAMNQYDVVLEDRGIDTMFSYILARMYQVYGYSYGKTLDWLETLNRPLNVYPNKTILLLDSISACSERYKGREGSDPLDDSDWRFLSIVQEAYLFLSEYYSDRFFVQNVGNYNFQAVVKKVLHHVS